LIGYIRDNKITLGYGWQNSRYENINTKVQTRANSVQNDVYAQTVLPFFKRFDLTLGGRSAWQENAPENIIDQPVYYTNHVFVTEQGLAFHPNEAWTLFVRRDGNFRFPKANEQVWLADDVTTLKPQTGVSYETGVAWQTLSQKTQLSFYRLALKNELAFDPTQTPMQPFGAISNLDETLRDGFSLTESYHLTPKIDLDGQLNYVDARFSDGQYSGNKIPAVPDWSASAGIGYKFLPHWKASYSTLYTGSSYAAQDVGNIGKKMPSYFLSRVALQYFFKQLNMSFEVNNVFNQRYATYTVYNIFTQQNAYYPGAGRNFLFTIKMNLD
jgi:iron complex outermembrane receptor protein